MTNTPVTGPIVALDVPWELLQALHAVLPGDWTAATYEAKFLGSVRESSLVYVSESGVTFRIDGGTGGIEAVDNAAAQLRRAELTPVHGPWFTLTVNLRSDGTQLTTRIYGTSPKWGRPVPAAAYAQELELFPRDEAAIPDWLRRPQTPEAGLRRAKVFDGRDEATGMPVVNRPRLPDDEARRVLEYLKGGPLFLFAHSYDKDVYAPDAPAAVPLTFATDGTWIWAGAVHYYLEKYGMPPEPELLAHIRALNFELPDVSAEAKEAARVLMTGPA